MNTRHVISLFLCLMSFCVACRERNHWPPETSGPNLPVRYCDIQKGDKDKTVIGYALVDTSAVNWLVVHDGGDGYWRVMVDLDNEEILNCYVNGLA